jgi:hypothetical protein
MDELVDRNLYIHGESTHVAVYDESATSLPDMTETGPPISIVERPWVV